MRDHRDLRAHQSSAERSAQLLMLARKIGVSIKSSKLRRSTATMAMYESLQGKSRHCVSWRWPLCVLVPLIGVRFYAQKLQTFEKCYKVSYLPRNDKRGVPAGFNTRTFCVRGATCFAPMVQYDGSVSGSSCRVVDGTLAPLNTPVECGEMRRRVRCAHGYNGSCPHEKNMYAVQRNAIHLNGTAIVVPAYTYLENFRQG